MLVSTIHLSIRNLMLHKLRSFLTMLGTILGVAGVIAMLAIGEGSKREALERIRQLGAKNVILRSVKPDERQQQESVSGSQSRSRVLEYGLRYRDLDILTGSMPMVQQAVPLALLRVHAQCGPRQMSMARVLGATPEYQRLKNLQVRSGRFLSDNDLATMANVAVLGAGAARRLFGFEDPLDKTVLLGRGAYRVVGVLWPHDSGSATPGAVQQDLNEDIYVPLTAARSRFGELQVMARQGGVDFERIQLYEITLVTAREQDVHAVAEMARKLVGPLHPRNDFEIQVPLELLRQAESEKRIWNLVLGSIAGISLLVGGIGIMNIMLATVTERTREIGIRRALGARRRDIIAQFLIESTVLSATGGLFGILLGVALPWFVNRVAGIETVIQGWTILLAFGISVAVGIIFGVYPARRAALMDPIEALRHQ